MVIVIIRNNETNENEQFLLGNAISKKKYTKLCNIIDNIVVGGEKNENLNKIDNFNKSFVNKSYNAKQDDTVQSNGYKNPGRKNLRQYSRKLYKHYYYP